MADLDHDGDLDIVTPSTQAIAVFLNNRDGTFERNLFPAGDSPFGIAIGHLNDDSDLDILATNIDHDSVSILYGNGDGTFGPNNEMYVGDGPIFGVISDFNKDGRGDFAITIQREHSVSVFLSDGQGAFVHQNFLAGTYTEGIATALDISGHLDIVVTNSGGGTISVLRGDGAGAFPTRNDFVVTGNPFNLALSDFNRDKKVDAAVVDNGTVNVSVLLGE